MNGDDEDLWREFTENIPPLPGRKTKATAGRSRKTASKILSPTDEGISPSPATRKSAGRDLDRRTEEKLRRGRMSIEKTLDLHGLTQDEAHRLLHRELTAAYTAGQRCLLVITGKGRGTERPGLLRARLPDWLAQPPLDDIVLRHVPAQPRHGGAGAFYILLRRHRHR